eukprot:1139049-Pelagomonas_calceolata.AAC.12
MAGLMATRLWKLLPNTTARGYGRSTGYNVVELVPQSDGNRSWLGMAGLTETRPWKLLPCPTATGYGWPDGNNIVEAAY